MKLKYCKRRLRKIYPNHPEELINMIAGLILVSIYSGELNKVIMKNEIRKHT